AELIFWKALNQWLDVINRELDDAYNVRSQLYKFLDACNVHIAPNEDNLMIGIGIASQIIRSVEEIHRRRLQGQSRRTPRGLMSEVYHAILRKQNDFGESIPIDTKIQGVLVTTVHQSKGLEWPVVIIPTLVNRRFPVSQKKHGTSYPDHIAARYGTSMEDERRLFYVAAMRAREHLFLLDPLYNAPSKRSIFLREQEDKGVISPTSLPDPDSPIWRIDHADLKEIDTPPIRIGLSDLLIYVECPYQFGLRRVVAVQPSVGDELGFGLGLHELIQRRSESKIPWSHKELKDQVEKHINLPYMSEKAENQSRIAIVKRLTVLEELGVFNSSMETEMTIEILVGQGIIHGIIDSVIPNPDGTVSIRDWKSNIHDEFLPRYERQIQFYVHAIHEQGRKVKQADIVDVASSAEQKKLVTCSIDVQKETLFQLMQTLRRSLNGIAEGIFTAQPSLLSCKACDMYRICSERIAL
ncbi:MAG TPA: 3'-5' exonuclease, partial [Paludibacter sp.]